MMRIAFDPQTFVLQRVGGISRYICSLAEHLSAFDGVEARIFAPLHVNEYLCRLPASLVTGRQVPLVPRTDRLLCSISQLLAWPLMNLFRPDIVHETFFAPLVPVPHGAGRVVTVYDMIHERFPALYSPRNRTSHWKRMAIRRADHVICISECTRTDLLDMMEVDPEKVTTIHLGFDPHLAATVPGRETGVSPEGCPYLLFVGNRPGYKNFPAFLRAFAASPWLRRTFRVVCFGGGALRADELDLMAALGLSRGEGPGQVAQTPGTDAELARAYRGAAAFVFPSLYEGFGIPLLEAMSLDCPVICGNLSSLPEVAGDAAAFFDPREPDAIRATLEAVLQSPERQAELVRSGRERVREFTWQRCAERTLAVYLQVERNRG